MALGLASSSVGFAIEGHAEPPVLRDDREDDDSVVHDHPED